jgi:choline-sulfatase
VLALLALLLGAGLADCRGSRPPRLVLLVVIDTLRADHLGCYGYAAIETPVLDRLAREGTLYEQAVTAVPVTLPAIATILTGVYPLQHGIRDNGPYALGDAWTTLAESFRTAGYATGAFVSADVLAKDHRLTQGFDRYDDDLTAPFEVYDPMLVPFRDERQGIERRADATVDRALAWARDQRGRPTFLFVHVFDPHLPRDPVPEFRERYAGRPYDGEIAFTDRELGRLFAGLRESWRAREILTLVVADHGEGLQDHEEEFHGDLLFDETVRVPLILQGPGVGRGLRIGELARTIDIAPTLCALANLPALAASPGAVLPGVSARAARAARAAAPADRPAGRGVACLETFRPRFAHGWCELRGLRTTRWKLIAGPEVELYDIAADPHERRDLAAQEPGVRDSLLAHMEAAARASLALGARGASPVSLTPEALERLRSLGYIGETAAPPAPADSLAIRVYPPAERGPAIGLADPRAAIAAYNRRLMARSYEKAGQLALDRGDPAEARRCFTQAIAADSAYAGDAQLRRRLAEIPRSASPR